MPRNVKYRFCGPGYNQMNSLGGIEDKHTYFEFCLYNMLIIWPSYKQIFFLNRTCIYNKNKPMSVSRS